MHLDRPIKKQAEDKLGRTGFARSIAAQIRRSPPGESFVVGLVGPWGSGKTSILNLIEEDLRSDPSLLFVWFNHDGAPSRTGQRLIIVIDDVDHLEDGEIRDVMRRVRLSAGLPDTIHLLSYDQARMEQALGGDARAKAHLEKIVQVAHHVPGLRRADLLRILSEEVNAVVASTGHSPGDEAYLQSTFHQGICPLFEGLREVHRYINTLRPTLDQIGEEVALADVLALEAIRTLEPAVFTGLVERSDASMQARFDIGGRRAPQIEHLIKHLFPATDGIHDAGQLRTWRRQRRVAHPDVFSIYVERTLPSGAIPTRLVRGFVENLDDDPALASALDDMTPAQIEQFLSRLEDYGTDFRLGADGSAVSALLDQLPRLQEGLALTRVVLQLLCTLDPARCLAIVGRQLPRIRHLSSRAALVQLVETHKLVDRESAADLAAEVARSVLEAPVDQLASERDLMRLLREAHAHDEAAAAEKIGLLIMDDDALLRALTSSLSGSVEYALAWWDELESIVGTECLRGRVLALLSRRSAMPLDEQHVRALETALRYVQGWRPG